MICKVERKSLFKSLLESCHYSPNLSHFQSIVKKRTTRKHIGASDQDKLILVLTPVQDGKFHDRCLLDASILVENTPKDIPIQGDLGLKGLEDEYDNIGQFRLNVKSI